MQLKPLHAALLIQYIAEKQSINIEDVVYLKTEPKPFTQNTYLSLSALHSCLTQDSRMLRKHVFFL